MLVEKYSMLQRMTRSKTEESAEAIMREEELLMLRDELAALTKQVLAFAWEAHRLLPECLSCHGMPALDNHRRCSTLWTITPI